MTRGNCFGYEQRYDKYEQVFYGLEWSENKDKISTYRIISLYTLIIHSSQCH